MKFEQSLQKNLKLLFRSKETAFTIIFGPLLIILLVGFAFSGESQLDITLGVYSPEYTELADSIIETLQESHTINIWSSEEECLDQVKTGINQMCLLFPADFEVREKHTNEVRFVVDPSRVNLVYQVIEKLNAEFDLQREELSLGLTGTILNNLDATKTVLDDQIENAESLQKTRSIAIKLLDETDGRMSPSEINFSLLDLRLLRGEATGIQSDVKFLYDLGIEEFERAIDDLNEFENACDGCTNQTRDDVTEAIKLFEESVDEFHVIYDGSPEKLDSIYRMIDDASSRIDDIENNYGDVQADAGYVRQQVDGARTILTTMRDRLTELRANLQYAHDLLDGVAVADSESIVSPIKTQIEEITTERSNLTFTYPYILMLVIMFMGLMLGSTLIVVDKNSRAAFRNFTTATRDEFHIALSFITTLLILLAQVFVILLFSYFLVPAPLLNNFGTSAFIILIAISLFSFLGMLVGFLSRSQEASMITSLTIGSVMLFVSNLVIPTEGMKAAVQAIANLNPYVVLSETLKKSMLFGVEVGQFRGQLLLLLVLVIVLMILTIGIQQYMRKKYFQQQATVEKKPSVTKKVKPLEIAGKLVKDEYDLLTVLDLMNREEFAKIVNDKGNPVYVWVLHEMKNKKLAKKLKTTSKEKMILRLDKYLKKASKKHTKR